MDSIGWDFDVPAHSLSAQSRESRVSAHDEAWFRRPHPSLLEPSSNFRTKYDSKKAIKAPKSHKNTCRPTRGASTASRSASKDSSGKDLGGCQATSKPRRATKPSVPRQNARNQESRSARRSSAAGSRSSAASEQDIKERLRQHNLKLARASTRSAFEPRHLNTTGIKAWESASGHAYDSLSMRDRGRANREIDMMST